MHRLKWILIAKQSVSLVDPISMLLPAMESKKATFVHNAGDRPFNDGSDAQQRVRTHLPQYFTKVAFFDSIF